MTVSDRIHQSIEEALSTYPQLNAAEFKEKVNVYLESRPDITFDAAMDQVVLRALEQIGINDGAPNWTFVASRLYVTHLYEQAARNRGYEPAERYGSFYTLIEMLTEQGIYNKRLLETYTEEEINEIGSYVVADRDYDFTCIGLITLNDRYLASSHDKRVFELPQERWLVIAMTLMSEEKGKKRLEYIKHAYNAMSRRYMTVATPTLANAGKSHGQLSSCFIDTIIDDLRNIYDSNSDIADLSKNGGGIGVYLGHIRSRGSDIKGYPGVSSGVIPWMKQLNNTAVSVDQLGQRQGALAVYLDVWHRDIYSFLDARLNNGDERQRTHDIFTGVCIPDIFMEAVEERGEWYIFDPHTIKKRLGFSLEDHYDEQEGSGTFRNLYHQAAQAAEDGKLGDKGHLWDKVPAIEIFKRIMVSQLETGTPYMFYRDTVNRANSNGHVGMIYCSNLCTEITQNQSATIIEETRTEDGKIIITKDPGDFVVCNLSSMNLGEIYKREGEEGFFDAIEDLASIQVRMLDNTIELNTIPVPQAQITNAKYRGVGLGTFGWNHLLALKRIAWNDERAVQTADEVYEQIAYSTIKASMTLAKEKGAYPVFKGSDFHTGAYFTKRNYNSRKWGELASEVQENGIRNGYLMAVAPNSSTSIIAGSTASIDPIFRNFYSEEKKNYKIPVTAPDLNPYTTWYYKTAYLVDQLDSIKQNAKRQRHIDQSISFNLYVPNNIQAKELLNMHMTAWREKLKTTYYVRSTSQEKIEECEHCHS